MSSSAKPEAIKGTKPSLRVWKFDVERGKKDAAGRVQLEYGFALLMPKGSQIFSVTRQFQTARIFALVNPALREEERYFWVAETNHDLPGPDDLHAEFAGQGRLVEVVGLTPLGTWCEMGDSIVKHLFEIVTEPKKEA
jgi:hypothetical protein